MLRKILTPPVLGATPPRRSHCRDRRASWIWQPGNQQPAANSRGAQPPQLQGQLLKQLADVRFPQKVIRLKKRAPQVGQHHAKRPKELGDTWRKTSGPGKKLHGINHQTSKVATKNAQQLLVGLSIQVSACQTRCLNAAGSCSYLKGPRIPNPSPLLKGSSLCRVLPQANQ